MSKNFCDRCGTNRSKLFWDFEDGSVLCNACHKAVGYEWAEKIGNNRFLRNVVIIFVGLLFLGVGGFLFLTNVEKDPLNNSAVADYSSDDSVPVQTLIQQNQSYCGDGVCNSNESCDTCVNDCGICESIAVKTVREIAETYNKTHTYSLPDFFVCADMAIDVWNLIKTAGINAEICAGNVNENIFETTPTKYLPILSKMNHAWVLAETSPFAYVAVEATRGYLVWGKDARGNVEKNELYYSYATFCFQTAGEFKKFSELRTRILDVCVQAENMQNYWSENIVGTPKTFDTQEYKGKVDSKIEECNNLINQMSGLLN